MIYHEKPKQIDFEDQPEPDASSTFSVSIDANFRVAATAVSTNPAATWMTTQDKPPEEAGDGGHS